MGAINALADPLSNLLAIGRLAPLANGDLHDAVQAISRIL